MPRRLPYNSSLDNCPDGLHLAVNDSYTSASSYLPFPSTGVWYLALRSQCFGKGGPEPCSTAPMVNVSLRLTQCSFGQCGQFGQCQLFSEATTVFSACVCQAGYRGMTCSDATYGLSKGEQLQAVYLLTLSNLFFLPSILLALHRRFFTLAAIFTFTFFFSTFYHACDTNEVYGLCITDYDTLSFCDFLGSVLSFWALLVTMARVRESWRTLLLMCGALVVAAVQSDENERHNTVAHVILVAVAGLVLVISWGLEMRRRRSLFPSWRRYLFCLLPGSLLALTGIVVNFSVTDMSQYQYSHSFWHFALMLAPCFLIPPRPKDIYGEDQATSIQSILSYNEIPDAAPASHDYVNVSERTPLITPARGPPAPSDRRVTACIFQELGGDTARVYINTSCIQAGLCLPTY
ncbi:hypothetical protein C0Q70_16150 [Pomacea canaliculata]|uniref:EGF-like domain-containing protein n=1 Tax=Pomacea canaliculata TaxID=400727 RepID=A0A2T7NNZ2_POMCA|nr:hypothetical protein C0Q70_16150 [Pomacea canaliculata]